MSGAPIAVVGGVESVPCREHRRRSTRRTDRARPHPLLLGLNWLRLGGKIVTVDPSDSKPSNVCLAGWDAHSVADACSSLESATRSLPCRGVVGVEANRRPGVQLLQLSVEECCADRSRGSAHHGLGGLQTSAQRLGLVRWIPSRCLGRHIGHE